MLTLCLDVGLDVRLGAEDVHGIARVPGAGYPRSSKLYTEQIKWNKHLKYENEEHRT